MVTKWELADLGQAMRRQQKAYAHSPTREGLDRCRALQDDFDARCRVVLEEMEHSTLASKDAIEVERILYSVVRAAPVVPPGLSPTEEADAVARRVQWIRDRLRHVLPNELCMALGW